MRRERGITLQLRRVRQLFHDLGLRKWQLKAFNSRRRAVRLFLLQRLVPSWIYSQVRSKRRHLQNSVGGSCVKLGQRSSGRCYSILWVPAVDLQPNRKHDKTIWRESLNIWKWKGAGTTRKMMIDDRGYTGRETGAVWIDERVQEGKAPKIVAARFGTE